MNIHTKILNFKTALHHTYIKDENVNNKSLPICANSLNIILHGTHCVYECFFKLFIINTYTPVICITEYTTGTQETD